MTGAPPLLLHGTAIALDGVAALLRGVSGSGKSDLALRCLGLPAGPLVGGAVSLVADDQVLVTPEAEGLRVSAPSTIAGRIEVRGLGIVDVPAVNSARLALVVDLVRPAEVERMPEARRCLIAGRPVACVALTPFEASAPMKLLLCLRRFRTQNP